MDKKPSIFVTTITENLIGKLKNDLVEQGFDLTQPPYTHFAAKKKGVSCTLYTSLKLTVQGKEMSSFIEFYLEPEILKNFVYTNPEEVPVATHARIGVDEAGKGDFFGPLCIAAVFAQDEAVKKLATLGVKDSKELSDQAVLKIARLIEKEYKHAYVRISPATYNELYAKFGNLNALLAWGHATAIDHLSKVSGCTCVVIDQFAHEAVVKKAIAKRNIKIDLTQRHRAEDDLVVAAASILARAAFLQGLKNLGLEVQMELPKGASKQVIETGKKLIIKWGTEVLPHVSKQHFKTTQQIIRPLA